MFALVLALIGCVATHHGPEGTTYDSVGDATDARILMDGDTANAAVTRGSKSVPVTVSTTVVDGRRRTSSTITVGGPVVASYGGMDPRLAQAVQYSAAYRSSWTYANGGVPTGRVTYGSAPASTGIDPKAECPKGQPTAAWSQAQLDACQTAAIKAVIAVTGVK